MKITIDLDNLKKLSKKGSEIFLRPEAEEELIAIHEAREQVEELYKEAKEKLKEEALKKNPNFSSIESDKVKVYYRAFGSQYRVDEANLDKIPEGIAKKKVSYSVDTKELNKFVKEKGKLPVGIKTVERNKQITFKPKKNEEKK